MTSLLEQTLKVLFRDPIVILVTGGWRKGKTDTSLLAGHLGVKWGLLDKIGSNIFTFNNPAVEYIITLAKLKRWLHADRTTKLFIFDEALSHIPRRAAMSQKNVSMLKLLAELSKGHGRMIFCTQILKIDSDILDPVFCRARWHKVNKKIMRCVSLHHPPRIFRGLPRSPIRFDPDRLAEFIEGNMSKGGVVGHGGQTYEICKLYVHGENMNKISARFKLHREQVKREIIKGLKGFLASTEADIGGDDDKMVNQEEKAVLPE